MLEIKYNNFLITGIHVNVPSEENFDKILVLIDGPGKDNPIAFRLVKSGKYGAMWCIQFDEAVKCNEALDYAHCLEIIPPIYNLCSHTSPRRLGVLPITEKAMGCLTFPITFELLTEICADEISLHWGLSTFTYEWGQTMEFSLRDVHGFIPMIKRCILDHNYLRSCSYLHLSMEELVYDLCDLRDDLDNKNDSRYVTVARAESSFLNAYKAIEILVGDPGKDRSKENIRNRLEKLNVNILEKYSPLDNQMVLESFITYSKLRDKVAAHGIGKKKRIIEFPEIIDLQLLASYFIVSQVFDLT